MQLRIIIVIVVSLSIGKTYAQDSTEIFSQLKDNTSPFMDFKEVFYSSPSLKSYERNYSFSQLAASNLNNRQDLYVYQKGSGNNGYQIEADSYLKSNSSSTLWGKAYYRNEKQTRVNYNESNDYDLIYPYVMADTIGGDLLSETYFFSGGFTKQLESFQYGLYASYRGLQSYRDRDPRPKNISSDIDAVLSISKPIYKQYDIALDLKFRKYNQNNDLQFVSELGAPLVFHDAGLGVYNSLLAGNRTKAYYNGHAFGGQLNIAPNDRNGFITQIGYKQFEFYKLLSNIIFPIVEVTDNTFNVLIGYTKEDITQNFAIKLGAFHSKRSGLEAKFNNRDASVSIEKISEDIRYISEQKTLNLQAIYGRKAAKLDWYIQGNAKLSQQNQQYISPDRKFEYSNLLLGLNLRGIKTFQTTMLTAQLGIKKLQNLTGDYYWNDLNNQTGIYEMLTANYASLTASNFQLNGNIRLDYQFSNNLIFFVQSASSYTSYRNNYSGRQLIIATGFIF